MYDWKTLVQSLVIVAGLVALSITGASIVGYESKGQTIAAWFQAVGSIAAVLFALLVAYQQQKDGREADKMRRIAPLLALRTIVDRAFFLLDRIPTHGPADHTVEHYFTREASLGALATVQHALQAFPMERLVDYVAIQCIFEMQDALSEGHRALRTITQGHMPWDEAWEREVGHIRSARARAQLAVAQLATALEEAGITNSKPAAGSLALQVTASLPSPTRSPVQARWRAPAPRP